jgi:hypothetical protein
MNKIVKLVLEGTIIGSTMIATNEVIGYHANPYKGATGARLSCNIASCAIGYYVGRKVSDFCVKAIDDVVTAYNQEVR